MDDAIECDIDSLLGRLEKHWDLVKKLTERIMDCIPDSDFATLDDELTKRDELESDVYKSKLTAQSILRNFAKKKQADLNDQMQQAIHDQAKDMESRFQNILATVTKNHAASSRTKHNWLPQTVKLPKIIHKTIFR